MPNPILMRKLRGGGNGVPFDPTVLPTFPYVYDTMDDHDLTTEDKAPSTLQDRGFGWAGAPEIIPMKAQQEVGEVDLSGATDQQSLDGFGGSYGVEGTWELN